MNVKRMCALLCASVIAGCGGNAGLFPATGAASSAAVLGSTAMQDDAGGERGRVRIRIAIPAEAVLRTRYVSPATRGMTADFTAKGRKPSKHVFALASDKRGCSLGKTALVCTFVVSLKAGRYRARVATYDAFPIHGAIPPAANELASDPSIPVTAIAGKERALKLRLDGVPAILSIVLPGGTAGTAFAPQPIGLDVQDADGNTILGKYGAGVVLFDSDASGATTLATQGNDAPATLTLKSSSDFATLAYTGLAIKPATIGALVTASTESVTASFAPVLQPIVVKTTDTQNPDFIGVDMNQTGGGPGSSGTLTVSEAGWSNAPYNKTFAASPAGGCASFSTTTPSNGSAFTVSAVSSPSPGECGLTLSDGAGQTKSAILAFTYFNPIGAQQSAVVPPGVTSVTLDVFGAPGAPVGPSLAGGGGYVIATVPVTPGETLYAYVGNVGTVGGATGFNGGGAGTSVSGSGGDASDVRLGGSTLADRIVVAGGGGGAGICGTSGAEGAGGGGSTGASAATSLGGGGGTQIAGGSAGVSGGNAGELGVGGAGGNCGGGGGGGGYYGGGGGGGTGVGPAAGGGGGGSSYVTPIATNVTSTQGTLSGSIYGGAILVQF